MTEDPPISALAREPTHYDVVRHWASVALDPDAWGALDHGTQVAALALLEAEHEAQQQRAEMPLALVELWEPECDHCDDPSKPTVTPEGKPCGRTSKITGRLSRGRTLTYVGPGERFSLHRCETCGYEGEHTSQRRVMQEVLDAIGTVLYFLVLGGNRASKSTVGALAATCCRLGADHPHVREFLARNGLSPGGLPRRPEFVYAVACTSNDSKLYVRPKLSGLAPSSDSWLGETGNQDAYLGDPPKAAAPGSVVCKSAEQGAKKMQGASTPLAWQDEDHEDEAVAVELGGRCSDQGGLSLFTMTPTRGWSPLLKWLLKPEEPRPAGSVKVAHLRGVDNPWVLQDRLRAWLDALGDRQKRIRMNGEIVAVEGAVHPGFDRLVHVVPAHDPPEGAVRVSAIDFGYRDPFVCGWGYIYKGRLHVYRLHYETGRTVAEHGQTINMNEACAECWTAEGYGTEAWWARRGTTEGRRCEACGGTGVVEQVYHRWADSADAEGRATLARDHDLPYRKAVKDRAFGYSVLEELLSVGRDGVPALTISDDPSCLPLVEELEELRWRRPSEDAKTRVAAMDVEGSDHGWDMLRYMAAGARKAGEL